MKKTITVFVLCNLLTLSAVTGCSSASSNNSQPTTQVATSQTKSKTVDSVSEAESVLIEYLESNSYAIEQTLKGSLDNYKYYIENIENLNVTTIDYNRYIEQSNLYSFIIKGNFYDVDDYGGVNDQLKFSMYVDVYADDGKVEFADDYEHDEMIRIFE